MQALKKENYMLALKSMPILVTGCSGYIASLLTKMLCEAGYNVRGTVRSKADATKVAHLESLCPENPVQLFEADLMVRGSFSAAVEGCSVVFHTASPFQTNVEDGQRDLVDPAVQGTLNVLASCKAAGTVERVVLTSSIAAVKDSSNEKYGETRPMGYVWSHVDFNDTSTLETNAYSYSKVGRGIYLCVLHAKRRYTCRLGS
jgi:nucleoside-diphosphate-sugar epimerase